MSTFYGLFRNTFSSKGRCSSHIACLHWSWNTMVSSRCQGYDSSFPGRLGNWSCGWRETGCPSVDTCRLSPSRSEYRSTVYPSDRSLGGTPGEETHNPEWHRVPSVCTDLWCNTTAMVPHPGFCSSFQDRKCIHGNVETAHSIPGKSFRFVWRFSSRNNPNHCLIFYSPLDFLILKHLKDAVLIW